MGILATLLFRACHLQGAERRRVDLGRRLRPHLLARLVAEQPLPRAWIELHPDLLPPLQHPHVHVAVVYRYTTLLVHLTRDRVTAQVLLHPLQTPQTPFV